MIYDTNSIALAVHAPVGIEVPKRSAAAGVCELNPGHLTSLVKPSWYELMYGVIKQGLPEKNHHLVPWFSQL